jgi:hypothetical protein
MPDLRGTAPSVPNAIAAFALHAQIVTGKQIHYYFDWTEGNPLIYLFKYLLFGQGENAPVTREILREAEPNPARRPRIHVG